MATMGPMRPGRGSPTGQIVQGHGRTTEWQRGGDSWCVGECRHDRDQRLVKVAGELLDLVDGPRGLANHASAHLGVRDADGCFESANALTLWHSVPVQHRFDEGSEGSVPIFF
jgi:hypothetical protein